MFPVSPHILTGLSLLLLSGPGMASLERAKQAVQDKNFSQAIGMLEAENGPQARLLQGLALAGMQRHSAAEETLAGLIAEMPSQPEAYNNLAMVYAGQGRLEEARALLEKAMGTHPAYATIYNNLTQITMEMSRSSYARALRLQGTESQMQLAALYDIGETAPIQQVVARLEAEDDAEVSAEVAAHSEPSTEPAANHIEVAELDPPPAVEEAAMAPEEEAPVNTREETPIEVVADVGPENEIEQNMYLWASAWAGQDVEAYLEAYSENFVPTGRLSLAQWQAQRRQRLARPDSIELELDEMEVLIFDARHARVRLTQSYRSDRYSDVTRKEFQMVRENGHWRISSERTLEVVSR